MKNLLIVFIVMICFKPVYSKTLKETPNIDQRVRAFLENKAGEWYDMNIPPSDGKLLYNLIIENTYTRALEIGTSTSHSAIWIAWALSKTSGKLVTIEIDKKRYETALENFREAGLSEYIDARLADAHQLVPTLEGPFDFVFCDADKSWYTNYFKAIAPKLEVGGCYTAHNTSMRGRGIQAFLDYVKDLSNYQTTLDNSSRAGVSITYKKSKDQ